MKKIGIISSVVVVVVAIIGVFVFLDYQKVLKFKKVAYQSGQEVKKRIDRGNAYAPFVKTTKDTILYQKAGKQFVRQGSISKNITIPLSKSDFQEDYFQIQDTAYYLAYQDVSKTEETNDRARSYLPFAEVIELAAGVKISQGTSYLELPETQTFPVYVKTPTQYGILYWNQLFFVSKEESKVVEMRDVLPAASEVAVLNYHFFYDPSIGETCSAGPICHDVKQFESHLAYITEEHFFTPTMKEFEQFMDGEIRLPVKSVLVTIDDGAQGVAEKAIPLLEQYDVQATLFLITGWFDYQKFNSDHLELHSHTNLMHTTGVCPGGQGGGIKCLPHDVIQSDLKTTRDLLHNTTAFAYPFYEYNDSAIANLKEAGFTIAFVGGGRKAKVGGNKMLVPRFGIDKQTTLEVLKSILS